MFVYSFAYFGTHRKKPHCQTNATTEY